MIDGRVGVGQHSRSFFCLDLSPSLFQTEGMERFIRNQIIQVSAAIERGQTEEIKNFISFAKKWHGSHFEAAAMVAKAHLISIGELEKAPPKRKGRSKRQPAPAASLPSVATSSSL